MKKINKFQNKTVLIIGGSGGIGSNIILELKPFVKQIINCSTSKVSTDISNEEIINYLVDISDNTHFQRCLEDIKNKFQVTDIIYTAGFSLASPIEYLKEEDYKYLFNVNYFGIIQTVQTFLKNSKNAPNIILISSLGSVIPIPYDSYYSASKIALNTFVYGLKLEKPHLNITTMILGGVKTPFTFKRKVSQLDDYYRQKSFDLANASLAKIEQSGTKPIKVTKSVVNIMKKRKFPLIKIVGFNNKIGYFLSIIVPKRILLRLIFWKFKSHKDK